MNDQLARTKLLLGEDGVARLKNARVAVFGLGGVGSYAVEALMRSGVGALDLIDDDCISVTNLNRVLYAVQDNVGQPKVEVVRARIASVCPDTVVRVFRCFYGPETADRFDLSDYDYIADAIDTVSAKLLLIERAHAANVPVISCMGAGNKLDPAAFRVGDLSGTSVCPLARVMRRELHKRGIDHVKVVWSDEPPIAPEQAAPEPNEAHPKRQTPGSCAFVPSVAGLILAGEIIRDLAGIGQN